MESTSNNTKKKSSKRRSEDITMDMFHTIEPIASFPLVDRNHKESNKKKDVEVPMESMPVLKRSSPVPTQRDIEDEVHNRTSENPLFQCDNETVVEYKSLSSLYLSK